MEEISFGESEKSQQEAKTDAVAKGVLSQIGGMIMDFLHWIASLFGRVFSRSEGDARVVNVSAAILTPLEHHLSKKSGNPQAILRQVFSSMRKPPEQCFVITEGKVYYRTSDNLQEQRNILDMGLCIEDALASGKSIDRIIGAEKVYDFNRFVDWWKNNLGTIRYEAPEKASPEVIVKALFSYPQEKLPQNLSDQITHLFYRQGGVVYRQITLEREPFYIDVEKCLQDVQECGQDIKAILGSDEKALYDAYKVYDWRSIRGL